MIFNLIMNFNLYLGIFCLYLVVDCICEIFHSVLSKKNCAAEVFWIMMSLGYLISANIVTSMKYLFLLVKGG
jgi:hypothetical protein|nr:MAG TPA: hypothetical protein [Caudoviricetes sp.]